MNIVTTGMTVADYCDEMIKRSIVVNREYQRSDKVWPPIARSYLIETILLEFPVPKLALHQITDVKSKKTYKEIVDGQQRSLAILDFFRDNLRLSSTLETDSAAGKTYSELDEELQHRFLDYSLSLDLFVATTKEEVREIFRRMNSYTVPLNPEEVRHAIYQGHFKWFINRITKRFAESFVQMGIFGNKQIIRMADTKLIAEICDSMANGIRTTNKKLLDKLYRSWDKQFPEEATYETRLTGAFDQLQEWQEIHNSPLMRPYVVYSLVLALIHLKEPLTNLQAVFETDAHNLLEREQVVENLSAMSEALEDSDEPGEFEEFQRACSGGTNVRAKREMRFKWICRALTETLT